MFKSDSNVYDIGRTILITQLSDDTTNKQLRVRCRKIGNIESLEYPVPGKRRLYQSYYFAVYFCLFYSLLSFSLSLSPGKDELTASVTFKTHKEAKKALDTLQSRTLNGTVCASPLYVVLELLMLNFLIVLFFKVKLLKLICYQKRSRE